MEVVSKDLSAIAPAEDNGHKVLTVTSIGDTFGIPSTRMNLILSELGWITKDGKDWLITESGKRLGGVQSRHERSGKLYVHWPETIVTNRILVNSVRESRGDVSNHEQDQGESAPLEDLHFREKFPATKRAMDGHYVRSKGEMIVDNWLYHSRIAHAYEKRLPVAEVVYCDFYINGLKGVYIEYWGYEHDRKYLSRKHKKTETYHKYGFQLIELTDKEVVSGLDDLLPARLRAFGIETE
jgi:hypothetical protein